MAAPDVELDIVGASDVGSVREHNEDHLLVGDLDRGEVVDCVDGWRASGTRGAMLVVCDGMGGVEGGEVASEVAARAMWREISATAATADAEVFARLMRRAVRVANHDVHALAKKEPGLRGMGTTLSAAAIAGDRLVVATVGDSRAYVLRAGALVQVSRDQSLHSVLLAAGHSEAVASTAGGAILQALGVRADVEPSLSMCDLRRGDRVLLCSDGLYGLVGDGAIALLLSTMHSVREAVRRLVTAARAAGGTDNITAVAVEIGGERFRPPAGAGDLPTFREFDPQEEGTPALSETSHVVRRLAARIGLPTSTLPPTIPVTGQHAVLPTRIASEHPVAVAVEVDGPARRHLATGRARKGWMIVVGALAAILLAWWLGGW